MARTFCFCFKKFTICYFWIFLCGFLLILTNNQSQAGPPGNGIGSYVEQYLESVEICSSVSLLSSFNFGKKKVLLTNFPNQTFALKISRWHPDYSGSFYNFQCRFHVRAPKKFGVMAVIQTLGLRTGGPIITNPGCRDYISFQSENLKSGPVCGELPFEDKSEKPDGLIGPRYFNAPNGDIEFTFSTGDSSFPRPDHNDIMIIFTAYSAECGSNYKPCSKKAPYSCIPSSLFCDKAINCGFFDSDDFGADENKCSSDNGGREMDTSFSNFSVVFAVTSIATLVVVIFFVFILCCCLQRVSKRSIQNNRAHQTVDAQEFLDATPISVGHMSIGLPTAPPQTLERGNQTIKSEDLPPQYNELFPVHSMKKSEDAKKH